MKKIIKNKYVIATFLCLFTYIIYLKIMRIYPFGEYSILKSDLYKQYINFFCYLREVFLNGKSIFISWNLGLANNFYTTFAYYLISPLNLLAIFFNLGNMDIFVEIIILIKIILMANFIILFLEKSYNYKSKETILFGLIYAYSSYAICYSFHIMWLDCLYMLPIVLLFVDKYLENGKIWPFVLSLSYSILTNYYIGYMVAFFAGIYYIARSFILKIRFKKVLKFLLGIIISFCIGMIVILPSMIQLRGKISTNVEIIKIIPDKIILLSNVLFNNYIYMFTQKSCFLFSSTFIIVLIPLYYFNNDIKKKEKVAFSAIIVFLLLPIISPFFYKLWHCFTTPNCFNYRYSFTLLFILILIGARELQNKKGTKKNHFIISALIFISITLIEVLLKYVGMLESDNYNVTAKSIVFSSLIYFIMFILTYTIFYKDKKIAFLLLLMVILIDLLIGAKSGQNNNDKYIKRNVINQYDKIMSYLKSKIKNPETERIIFEPDEYGGNMSLKYGYSNIGFFSSARNRDILKSMYRLGYNVQMDEQLWITSYSGTFLNYSMVGVNYYISKNQIDIYGFELEEKYDNYYIYKNKNNFEIGYYLEKNIEESYNPFKMQNELIQRIGNTNADKFFETIDNSSMLECEKNIKVYDDNYIINYKLKAKEKCSIYFSSDYDLKLYIDGKQLFKNYSNIWSTETGIKQIKNLRQNEELDFTIITKQNLDLLYIYASNNNEIQNVLETNDRNILKNIKVTKSGVTGEVIFKDDGYLTFSIAYDNCWDIYIDKKQVDKEKIAGCFLGTKIEKGKHYIELRFNALKLFMF